MQLNPSYPSIKETLIESLSDIIIGRADRLSGQIGTIDIVFNVGKKKINISTAKLNIKESQSYVIHKGGIPKINNHNIYDIVITDIVVHIILVV